VSQTGDTLNIRDTLNDPYCEPHPWNAGFQTLLVVPIFHNSTLVSVLELYRRHEEFSEHDERIAGRLTQILGKIPVFHHVFNMPDDSTAPTTT
jgi:GAF domain-containing protein